jgi:triosephosphate isomerase
MIPKLPIIIINLKTYEQGSGKQALELAYTCEKVAQQENVNIAIAPQNSDIYRIAEKVDIPIFAQHIDPATQGSNTGKDIAETLRFNGADGVLINHSEDQVALETIEQSVKRAKANDLQTVVCIDVPEMAEEVSDFNPDFVAFEPPELIGGDVSVSTASPDLVEDAVEQSSATVLCGAGIKDADDVTSALNLGTEGVLVASGVVKANHPEAALRELVAGINQ